VYDPEDNHVGRNYETGEFEAEIPGAEFSGPDSGAETEQVQIPSGVRAEEIKVVAVDADDPVDYAVDSAEIPPTPASLRVFPNSRSLTLSQGESGQTSISIREIAGFSGLTDVQLSPTALTATDGEVIQQSAIEVGQSDFSIPAGGSTSVDIVVSVPTDALSGTYTGQLRITANGGDQSSSIPLTAEVVTESGLSRFDRDDDGQIGFDDLRYAVREYNRNNIDFDQLRRVVLAYNTGENV